MLYVTLATAGRRSTRRGVATDVPAEAIAEAVKDWLPAIDGPTTLTVLVEPKGTRLDKIELAEEIELVRDAEVKRARS